MSRLFILALLPMLSCLPLEEPPVSADQGGAMNVKSLPHGDGDACQANNFQNLLGKDHEMARISTLPEGARILYPNSIATADFRPDRLNVRIGANNLIESVHCG